MKFKFLFIALTALAFLSSAIDSGEKLNEGSKVPEIKTLDGSVINPNDGKMRLVNFWSPKDPVSRIANKEFSDYFSSHENSDIEFISICTDSDDLLAQEVIRYDGAANGRHISYSDLPERIFKDYQVADHPEVFLLDTNGKLLRKGSSVSSYLNAL